LYRELETRETLDGLFAVFGLPGETRGKGHDRESCGMLDMAFFFRVSCVASERARKHGFGIGCFFTFMPRRRGEEEQEKKTCKLFDPLLVLALAETRHGNTAHHF